MTSADRGLADLAVRLDSALALGQPWYSETVPYETFIRECAAAILADRAVFLPDGLREFEFDLRQDADEISAHLATIATLRAALVEIANTPWLDVRSARSAAKDALTAQEADHE
jgi:hypothetical protein